MSYHTMALVLFWEIQAGLIISVVIGLAIGVMES